MLLKTLAREELFFPNGGGKSDICSVWKLCLPGEMGENGVQGLKRYLKSTMFQKQTSQLKMESSSIQETL